MLIIMLIAVTVLLKKTIDAVIVNDTMNKIANSNFKPEDKVYMMKRLIED